MNYYKYDIVFQEIPDEISLAIYFTGCPLQCKGCHSPELWNPKNGSVFTSPVLKSLLQQYEGEISCLLFMGGEWNEKELISFAELAVSLKIKVALYTGRELHQLSSQLISHLTYLKTGPWREELGGLDSPTTNQKIHLLNKEQIIYDGGQKCL